MRTELRNCVGSQQNVAKNSVQAKKQASQSLTRVIGERMSLLGNYSITMRCNEECGLTASVHVSESEQKEMKHLPVVGLPKEFVTGGQCHKRVESYLKHTYWLAERGTDGTYNRVSVHLSAKGGGHGKIPFQEGLALGSIVKGEVIYKLNKYAEFVARTDELKQQIEHIQQRIQILDTKLEQLKPKPVQAEAKEEETASQAAEEALANCYRAEKAHLLNYLNGIIGRLSTPEQLEEIPVFTRFSSSLASPVDHSASTIVIQPRGFDSSHFSSYYFDCKDDMSTITDKINQASSSGSVTGSVKKGFLFFKASASASRSWAESVTDRIFSIRQEGRAQGVLVINAMVTTRHVRCYSRKQFDLGRLQMIVDAMELDKNEGEAHGISYEKNPVEGEDDVRAVYMLTEAVLGGSFTAFVSFLSNDTLEKRAELNAKEHQSQTTGSAGGGFWGFKGGVNFSRASGTGEQSESDQLNSNLTTQIEIDFIAQGALPTFARDVIEREIVKNLNINASDVNLSQQEEEDIQKLTDPNLPNQERAAIELKQRLKMQNAQISSMGAVRALKTEKQKMSVHTASSVMEAYENFSLQMVKDKECGVPIGFNYERYSEGDIKNLISKITGEPSPKKDDIKPAKKPKPTDSQANDAGGLGNTPTGAAAQPEE